MKKVRRSGSSRKSRSSSKSSFFSGRSSSGTRKSRSSGSSFFSKKRRKTSSKEKARKPHKSAGAKDIFIKPPHDPGPKNREGESGDLFIKPPHDPGPKTYGEETEVVDGYVEEGSEGVVQQALHNTGCGCCSSIAGLIWFMAIGALAVVILLIVKCGGC